MKRTPSFVIVVLVAGCPNPPNPPGSTEGSTEGSTTDESQETSDTTSGATGPTSGGGAPCAGQLLENGSFESWTDDLPDAWDDRTVALTRVEGIDGDWAASGTFAAIEGAGQTLPMALPAEACFEVGLWLRLDSGTTDRLVRVRIDTDADFPNFPAAFMSVGEWVWFENMLCVNNDGGEQATFVVTADETDGDIELSIDGVSVCLL